MAAVTRTDPRRLSVIALVAALHGAICWLLLQPSGALKFRTASGDLELIYLIRDPPVDTANPPARTQSAALPARRPATSAAPTAPQPAVPPSTALQDDESNAIHPPVDWANELTRAATESAAALSAPRPREFGAPHVGPAPPPKPVEFGWSRSRTHRVESAPGVTAIHVGEHCVIAFTPLPFPVCTLGKDEANGELFKHMRDPPNLGDWKP